MGYFHKISQRDFIIIIWVLTHLILIMPLTTTADIEEPLMKGLINIRGERTTRGNIRDQ